MAQNGEMAIYLLSTCPAANGVRRMPTTYGTQSLLMEKVLVIPHPVICSLLPPVEPRSQASQYSLGHVTVRGSWHWELITLVLVLLPGLLLLGAHRVLKEGAGGLSSH